MPRYQTPGYEINYENQMSEIKILSNLNNPNIIQAHELLQDNELFYIVTEFCQYGTL